MIQTLIPAFRPSTPSEPLSSASIASREAHPVIVEPEQVPTSDNRDYQHATRTTADPTVYDDPRKQAKNAVEHADEKNRELAEQLEVQTLAARDREVRAHERAHAAVGGQYASAPTYQYERGPDGINYAVAGEVQISVGPVPGDPQATIEKAQIVRRAALAPAEPSAQDRQVAAQATQMEMQALVELSVLQQEQLTELEKTQYEVEESDNNTQFRVNESDASSQADPIENPSEMDLTNKRLPQSLDLYLMSKDRVESQRLGQMIDLVA